MITAFLSQFWVQKIGWTLLHFLWQGTAVVVVYAVFRNLLARLLSAHQRYVMACLALATMAVAPPVTFLSIRNAEGSSASTIPARIASWTVPDREGLLIGVVALWLVGVLAFSIRLFGGWRSAVRLQALSHPAPPGWQKTLERIAVRMGASSWGEKHSVALLISSQVDVPTVIGWLRPAILVPVEFLTGLRVEHIAALLAHELAHIYRRDYMVSLLQGVVEAALFYHPAIWWISEQIRIERELCCDDLAVAVSGDVLTYARALAELEDRRSTRLIPALAANGGLLVSRIRRLIEPEQARVNHLPGPGIAGAMVLLWFAGVGVAMVHAAEPHVQAPLSIQLSVAPPLPPWSTAPSLNNARASLVGRARKTLLYDPFLSAQLAPLRNGGQPSSDGRIDKLEPGWQEWLNNDVAYILTDEERATFLHLTTNEEREQFEQQFWLRRDPTPDTFENEFKNEHYRRISYADEHFGSRIPGWKDDRGLAYIAAGPPDEIEVHRAASAQAQPSELWSYRAIDSQGKELAMKFVDNLGTGEYRLTGTQPDRQKLIEVGWTRFRAGNNVGISQPAPNLRQAPHVRFNDLEAAMATKAVGDKLPMQVRVDYVRGVGPSAMANITVQLENQDLQFEGGDGNQKSRIDILGRVSTMTRRPLTTFESTLEILLTPGVPRNFARQRNMYQQSVPLSPGLYRLNIVAKDAVSGNLNNYEVKLDVPRFEEGKLGSSTLVLAEKIEKMSMANISGGANFVISDTTVRPRLGNRFTNDEKLGIYLQVYNLGTDETTHKPSGSIRYEIERAGAEKIVDLSEDVGGIANASDSQVTIEKLLPLRAFDPGTYTLRVTATDNNGNQTAQQGNFTVIAQ